ncbi:MAG: GNAT family N-acetyltransferase [Desulfuromonadaceae bacterium]|nr:GNAT family N-acetyltransferase [Desulfuromonadaceae bacterium]MDD5105682.1 GNAT family N-acetyltransferase [Desulfuromonadaceae bacterium]
MCDSKNVSAVRLRRATLADLPAITDIYNEAVCATTATFDTEPKLPEDRVQWFNDHDETHPILVAELDGAVIGWSSLSRWSERRAYNLTAESSSYVSTHYRGKGIGRKLKEAMIEEAHRLGLHTLIARIVEGNDESLHLNESLGFVHIGTMKEVGLKFGRFLDVHIFQKMLHEENESRGNSLEVPTR